MSVVIPKNMSDNTKTSSAVSGSSFTSDILSRLVDLLLGSLCAPACGACRPTLYPTDTL